VGGIYCDPNFGPSFGYYGFRKYDMWMQGLYCKINFPLLFEDNTGKGSNTFAGSSNVEINDIVVYSLKEIKNN